MTELENKKKILIDILINRKIAILNDYKELSEHQLKEKGVVDDWILDLKSIACSIDVIIDEIELEEADIDELVYECLQLSEQKEYFDKLSNVKNKEKSNDNNDIVTA